MEFPELWVAAVERANARHSAALGELVRNRTAETKSEYAAACREFAEVLSEMPAMWLPSGLHWVLRHHAVESLRADARDAESWARFMQGSGE